MRRTVGETIDRRLEQHLLAVPDFIWALALVLLFAVAIPVLPLTGRIDPELAEGFHTRFYLAESMLTGRFAVAGDIISHMVDADAGARLAARRSDRAAARSNR